MILLRLVYALATVYLMLIFVRAVLSWFRGSLYNRAWDLLVRATDPYLSLFHGLRFLRRGAFDFTPIAAILVLLVFRNLVSALLVAGRVTLGLVVGSLVGAVWWAVTSVLLLYVILVAVRLLMLLLRRDAYSPFTQFMDGLLAPVMGLSGRLMAGVGLGRQASGTALLLVTIGLLLAVLLVGDWIVRAIVGSLYPVRG